MVAGIITVVALTAKMVSVSAASQKVMDKHEQVAKEREARKR